MDNFNYDKTKENELNQDEFVKFWADLYALFEKIDKDGDGEIAVVECVSLLDDKAEKFGLSKGGLLLPGATRLSGSTRLIGAIRPK